MNTRQRIYLGRRLLDSGQKLQGRIAAFHQWLKDATSVLGELHITPVLGGGRVVAVDGPLGRICVADELTRRGERLVAQIVFYRPAGGLLANPRRIYAVELHDGGTAYFDTPEPENEFDWDLNSGTWASQNARRLACELAIACSEPCPNATPGNSGV